MAIYGLTVLFQLLCSFENFHNTKLGEDKKRKMESARYGREKT